MEWERFDALLDAALAEDAASRDVTTRALVAPERVVSARVRAGGDGVVCGLPLAQRLAERFDTRIEFDPCARDGEAVAQGAVVAALRGPAASILAVERVMLNFLQRLSGVATLAARFVEAVEGTGAHIYDTRKTTPGWRRLEKYAVRCGGGCNHRMDLGAAVLIKDNHLALAAPGGIADAVRKAREACPDLTVEVEVEDLSQLEGALAAGPDVIMLDNMTPDEVRRAAEMVRRSGAGAAPAVEASGSITLANAAEYAAAGADRISVGALTHSAPAFDLSLDIVP